MKIFNKTIHQFIICLILAQGVMPIVASAKDSDLQDSAFAKELVDIVRSQIYYPQSAITNDVEGALTVQIKINKEGHVLTKKFTQRSGSRLLDLAVIRMIGKLHSFPGIPSDLKLNEFNFEVPLTFILKEKNGSTPLLLDHEQALQKRSIATKFNF